MAKERDSKEIERLRALFRREILRTKAARLGLSFEHKVALAKQRRGILNSLIEKDNKVNKAARALKEAQKKYIREADKLEAEVGFTKARGFPRPFPPMGPIHQIGPEVSRTVALKFLNGVGTGAPPVFETRNGLVGWSGNVDQFVNDDTGHIKYANFMLLWYAVIPRAGFYKLESIASWFRVDMEYKLTGSGLWGEDASLEVWIGSGLHIYNPVEYITVTTLEVSESKSAFGSTKGRLFQLHDLADVNQCFEVKRNNTTVTFSIVMDIETWAEDGKVRVDVYDFYLPSIDANNDFTVKD